MKKIVIGQGCVGCGLCVQKLPSYVKENTDGNAIVIEGKPVDTSDVSVAEKIVEQCQGKVFKLVDVEQKSKESIVQEFEKKVSSFSIPKFTSSNFNYDVMQCYISVPGSAPGEYSYSYSSESSARSAAKSAFRPVYDSYKAIVQEVAVAVKQNLLKPYYCCDDNPNSGYYVFNEQIRKMLADTFIEMKNVGVNVPEKWKEFSVYFPDEYGHKDNWIESIEVFDKIGFANKVWDDFRDGSYSGIDNYVDLYMNFDSMETGETGFFGGYKEKYCFRDFYKASEEYVKDIKSSIRNVDIVETGRDRVNSALVQLEGRMQKELNKKLAELKSYVG